VLTLKFDGGARGNPGPSGYGFAIFKNGSEIESDYGFIGETTNNVAEYVALINGLQCLVDTYPNANVKVIGDSRLVIKQVTGEWSANDGKLVKRLDTVNELLEEHNGTVTFKWTKRKNNGRADELANKAIDEHQNDGNEMTELANKAIDEHQNDGNEMTPDDENLGTIRNSNPKPEFEESLKSEVGRILGYLGQDKIEEAKKTASELYSALDSDSTSSQ